MSELPKFSSFQQWLLKLRGPHFTPKWLMDLYGIAVFPCTFLFSWVWKKVWRPPPGQEVKLHLGSGPIYFSGWINGEILFLWRRDCWLDLRHGLPFPNESISALYANQVMEHLSLPCLQKLLCDCHRVLKPGGRLRFVVPSFAQTVRAYQAGEVAFFQTHLSHLPHQSLCAAANEFLLCRGHHLILFDFAFFQELLQEAGTWASIHEPEKGTSLVLTSQELEQSESRWGDIQKACLVIEAQK